jgi:beta-ketoacyl-acyl-carrier-protein synthase II
MTSVNRVVITGMGVVSAIGSSVDSFWQALIAGESGITHIEEPFLEIPVKFGGYAKDFTPEEFFSTKEIRRISRSSQLAVVATRQALAQAELTEETVEPESVAIVVGSSIGGFAASEPYFATYYRKGVASPLVIPKSMNSGPSSHISMRYGFKGPLMSVDAACATAAQSIGYVYNMIRFGQLEIAITGGADSPFAPAVVGSWDMMRALSRRKDDPARACRPFSGDRDGMVLGEGAGILVIESEASAKRRGKKILAEITGYGASSDSHHITQPTLDGPVKSMRDAIADAGLEPADINYINAHGTATWQNDKNETAAIKAVFNSHAKQIPVVANKANFGHSIAGSGALELIGCVKSINENLLPPTINYTTPDEECDLDYVTEGKRSHPVSHVLSNSFAFGGSNATLVVSEYYANGTN